MTHLIILTLVGIFVCPVLTLGCVLVYFGHPVLGVIAVIYSLLKGNLLFEKITDMIGMG